MAELRKAAGRRVYVGCGPIPLEVVSIDSHRDHDSKYVYIVAIRGL